MEAKLLAHDTALVTGAASGIGRGIAIAIAREGARVLLCDIDVQRGEATAASLRREGCDASFFAADPGTPEGPGTFLTGGLDKFGIPSIFVHAATWHSRGNCRHGPRAARGSIFSLRYRHDCRS